MRHPGPCLLPSPPVQPFVPRQHTSAESGPSAAGGRRAAVRARAALTDALVLHRARRLIKQPVPCERRARGRSVRQVGKEGCPHGRSACIAHLTKGCVLVQPELCRWPFPPLQPSAPRQHFSLRCAMSFSSLPLAVRCPPARCSAPSLLTVGSCAVCRRMSPGSSVTQDCCTQLSIWYFSSAVCVTAAQCTSGFCVSAA